MGSKFSSNFACYEYQTSQQILVPSFNGKLEVTLVALQSFVGIRNYVDLLLHYIYIYYDYNYFLCFRWYLVSFLNSDHSEELESFQCEYFSVYGGDHAMRSCPQVSLYYINMLIFIKLCIIIHGRNQNPKSFCSISTILIRSSSVRF